jgi:large subunit ribosomal protein L3
MIKGLLGQKLGMTQIFDERGQVVPVTVLRVGPCVVTQLKTIDRDGYEAVQLGFGESKRLNRPERGQRRAAGSSSRWLREMKADNVSDYHVGQVLDVSMFSTGTTVDVTGTSKGKGFQGVVKRHGFSGGPKTHGQSDRHRAPGSIGSSATPGRVFKNLKMAGHMGHERKTIQGLEVVRVDPEQHLMLVKGSVPGTNNGLLIVRTSVKSRQAKR